MKRDVFFFLSISVLVGLSTAAALAGGGPERTVVVVNAASWASQTVANHYVRLRQVPVGHVIHLELGDLPSFEDIAVGPFRERILEPVLTAIRTRGLEGQIDCIAYSSDIPSCINVQGDVGRTRLPSFITPQASINGLTFLHRPVLAGDIRYLVLRANLYAPPVGRPSPEEPWPAEDRSALMKVARLLAQGDAGSLKAAEEQAQVLADKHPESREASYNLACVQARRGRGDAAMASLTRAVVKGYVGYLHARKDDDLASLRGRGDFQDLLARMKAAAPDISAPPPLAFSSASGWNVAGEPAADGPRYMLSTMLAVTSGRGLSVSEAVENLRRSAGADGTAPRGTVYFCANDDIRSTCREFPIPAAVAGLRRLGVAAEILEQATIPLNKPDVAGVFAGTAAFDWKASGSTILPGAICEHMTSCGGMMRFTDGQTPLTEFLRAGAAGASGTVAEPYVAYLSVGSHENTGQDKFPLAFIQAHYAAGCSLAEAFYRSIAGPYQLLIVGDPLCRPWARIPAVTVTGVESGSAVTGRLSLKPSATTAAGVRIARFELYVDGRLHGSAEPGRELIVETERCADGYHELGVAAVTADPVATRSWTVLPVAVRNRDQYVALTAASRGTVVAGAPLEVRAAMAGARRIYVTVNGRVLEVIQGAEGTATLATSSWGLGPVRLQAHAAAGDEPAAASGTATSGPAAAPVDLPPGALISSEPVDLDVEPAAPLAAVEPPPGLVSGLSLSLDGGEPWAVQNFHDGTWIAKTGAAKGQTFGVEGWFEVPQTDVYQFQVRPGSRVSITVDGTGLVQPEAAGFRLLPVSLAKGWHRLRAEGRFEAAPNLDIRFGGPGGRGLNGERFSRAGQARELPPAAATPPPG